MLGLGLGLGLNRNLGLGSQGPDLSSFLKWDDFAGTPASLNGRTPPKGPVWQTSGAAAANMIAGGGYLTQNADVLAGYGFTDHGQVARKLVGTWEYNGGDTLYPCTLAICVGTSAANALLHGEGTPTGFYIRIFDPGPTPKLPSWALHAAAFALVDGQRYKTELHYNGTTMAAMVLRDATTNAILTQQVVYDLSMADYVGNYTFFQTYNSKMRYSLATVEALSDYTFPTLDIRKATTFPSNADGFVNGPFGGSVTWGSQQLAISMSTQGSGGSVPIGSVLAGDKIYVSFDRNANTGDGFWLTVIGASPVGEIIPFNVADGTRVQKLINITTSEPNASVLICSSGLGDATSLTIDNFVAIKNPPTGF